MIIIEIATIADIEDLARAEIQSKLLSFGEQDDDSVDYDKRLNQWQMYFSGKTPASARPERIVFKAIIDGQIIGLIAGHLTSRYNMDAEIQKLYVLKTEQRLGIGSKMLQKSLPWFIGQGAKTVCVGVAPENPYRAFYLKYGARYLNPHWLYWDDITQLQSNLRVVGPI